VTAAALNIIRCHAKSRHPNRPPFWRVQSACIDTAERMLRSRCIWTSCAKRRGTPTPCTCWASSRRSGTTIKPDYADAHYNRGNVLQSINRQEEALAAYDQALAIAPGHTEALNNRSNVLIHLNRLEDALASYDQALALAPHQAELHYNRGNVLQGFGASR
jgi:tetratricopeptide (TPR) repeat protein